MKHVLLAYNVAPVSFSFVCLVFELATRRADLSAVLLSGVSRGEENEGGGKEKAIPTGCEGLSHTAAHRKWRWGDCAAAKRQRETPKRKRSLAPSTEETALAQNLSLRQLCQSPEMHQSVSSQYIRWNCSLTRVLPSCRRGLFCAVCVRMSWFCLIY